MRCAIVAATALVGIVLASADTASAAQCSVIVGGTSTDVYNNVVFSGVFPTTDVGVYPTSNDCVFEASGGVRTRAHEVCLNRLSAVSLHLVGDVYFGGVFVQTISGEGSCREAFGLNYYTTLGSGQSLSPGSSLDSFNGDYELRYQTDGNLVLYQGGSTAVWAINCWPVCNSIGNPGVTTMQNDGNFVVYDDASNPVWYSGTQGNNGAFLALREGKLVIFATNGSVLWQVP